MRSKVEENGRPNLSSENDIGLPPSIKVPAIRVVSRVTKNKPIFNLGISNCDFFLKSEGGTLTFSQTILPSPITSATTGNLARLATKSSFVDLFTSSPIATQILPLVPILFTCSFPLRW